MLLRYIHNSQVPFFQNPKPNQKPNLNLFNEFILKLTKPKTNYDKCFKYYKLFEIRLHEKQKKKNAIFYIYKTRNLFVKNPRKPSLRKN